MGDPNDPLTTYRYLRLGLAVLLALLAAGVLREIIALWQLRTSISAFYYTPARAVFIASLCAVGTCLIVYKGNSRTEDLLLNFTGVAQFIVAFVPTNPPANPKGVTNLPTANELTSLVTNSGWSLSIAGGLALVLLIAVRRGTREWKGAIPTFADWQPIEIFWLAATFAAFVADFVYFVHWRAAFVDKGHDVAASATFVGIVLVVVTNALSFGEQHDGSTDGASANESAELQPSGRPSTAASVVRRTGRHLKVGRRYTVIAVVMVLSLAGIGGGHLLFFKNWKDWLFFLEASTILEFAWFWIVQTHELWGGIRRGSLPPSTQPVADASPVAT